MTAQGTTIITKNKKNRRVDESFPAILIILLLAAMPIILVGLLQGQVSALSLKLADANHSLQLEDEKLKQLNYHLKELQSLQRIEQAALSMGFVKNDNTEIVVLVPPPSQPAASTIPMDAGPVDIKGAVTASLFDRLLDFLYGLLGGSELL